MNRRDFLRSGAALSAVGLAGCPGGDSDGTPTNRDDGSTDARTPTETAESESTDDGDGGDTDTEAEPTDTEDESTGTEEDGTDPRPEGIPRLETDGKWIVTETGDRFTPRGVNLVEPLFADQNAHKRGADYREHLELATDTSEAWYNTVLRVPVNQWGIDQLGIEEYATRFLDPTVEHCRDEGVYLILDYHIIEDWQDEAIHAQVETFWDFFAPRYADEPHVLYEFYNEPQNPADNTLENWNAWKDVAQPWVDRIREDAPETPIVVGSPQWTSLTRWAAESPFEGENLIYAGHIYPGDGREASAWEEEYGAPADEVPVMITEFGWSATNDTQPGTTSEWGDPFREWLDGKENVGWTAWCFDSHWGPTMVDFDFNTKGGDLFHGWAIKQWLYEERETTVPEYLVREGAAFEGPTDDRPPQPPANIEVTENDQVNSVTLAWDQSTDESTRIQHYNVYVDGAVETRASSLILLNEAEADADDPWSRDDLRFERALQGFIPGRTYDVSVTAVDSLSNESEPSEVVTHEVPGDLSTDVDLPKTDTSPTVDGELDDVWDAAPTEDLVHIVQGGVDSDQDLAVTWRGLWDEEALYVHVDVSDDGESTDSDALWQDDCVEIYVDGDNSKQTGYDGNNDFQIQYRRGTEDVSGIQPSDVGDDFAWNETGDGYQFEVALPWSAIAPDQTVEADHQLGLDVHVNDDDGGGERDGKLNWNDTEDVAWDNPSVFGTAKLVAE